MPYTIDRTDQHLLLINFLTLSNEAITKIDLSIEQSNGRQISSIYTNEFIF
jgi:hypothetical protein